MSRTDPESVEGANQLGKQHEGTQSRGACMGVQLQYHLSDLWVCSLELEIPCLGVPTKAFKTYRPDHIHKNLTYTTRRTT